MNIIAQPLDYQEFIDHIRARVVELGAPHQIIEQHMELTPGYLGKVLGAAQVRNIGFNTMWRILDGIGYRIALVEHLDLEAAIDEIKEYRTKIVPGSPPGKTIRTKMSPAIIRAAARHYGAMGRGIRKAFRIKPSQVKKQRRAAIKVRWAKHRAALRVAKNLAAS